jgi:HK97 family phage portal protein
LEILSSIRALREGRDRGESISLELRAQPTLNTPAVPLGGVGFEWAYEMGGGNATVSGEAINDETAMRITTVYACIRILSQSIASLPCVLRETTDDGSRIAAEQQLFSILGEQPNVEMGRHRFWSTIVACMMLTGAAYAQVVRDRAGRIAELYPLHPALTEPYRQPDGTLAFRTRQGQKEGQWKELAASEVCHFVFMTFDGVNAISPIKQARETLGLSRAAEKATAKLFGNGGRPGGLLTGPAELKPEQKESAKTSWLAAHGGSNTGGTAVLSGEWTYTPLTLSPEDSQFLGTMQFTRTQVGALYGIPANMLGDTTRLSNGNWENINLSFITDTLQPIIDILEDEINRKLMPQVGRKAGAFFAKLDLDSRLSGDFETRMKGFALGRQNGWFSANDIRRKLGENKIDDPSADVYLYPVNMANSAQLPAQADEINIDEQTVNEPETDTNDPKTQD